MSDYIGYSSFPTLDEVLNPAKQLHDVSWIAQNLTRTGTSWSSGLGQGATVTYSFATHETGAWADSTFWQFQDLQIQSTKLALKAWSDVANIHFVQTAGTYGDDGQIKFEGYTHSPSGASGMSQFPGSRSATTAIWVGPNASYASENYQWLPDGFNAPGIYANLIHEIGHAIGLSHPSDYNSPFVTYDADATYYQDSKLFSVMSYFDGRNGVVSSWQVPETPGIDDIAAAQRLYGANMTTRTGDTTYGFNSNADEAYFHITGDPNQSFVRWTVWDAGGNDTFDFSGYDYNHVIDLREGHLSSVSHLSPQNSLEGYNVGIAYGTTIENAIGGSGGEMFYGNDANNHIVGNAGADFINGGAGSDTLEGGDDNDHVYGNGLAGAGAVDGGDLIHGGNGHDYVNGNAGNDTVYGGSGNDRIQGGQNDDQLNGDTGLDQINGNLGNDTIHGGDDADSLQGGQGDDQVYGDAGNDTVIGNKGIDALTGGLGNDVFRFNHDDALIASGQTDRITDFAADDRISIDFGVPTQVLHGSATSLAAATTAAHDALMATNDPHAIDAVQIGSDTFLFFDAASDGHVEAIGLVGVSAASLGASAFD